MAQPKHNVAWQRHCASMPDVPGMQYKTAEEIRLFGLARNNMLHYRTKNSDKQRKSMITQEPNKQECILRYDCYPLRLPRGISRNISVNPLSPTLPLRGGQ